MNITRYILRRGKEKVRTYAVDVRKLKIPVDAFVDNTIGSISIPADYLLEEFTSKVDFKKNKKVARLFRSAKLVGYNLYTNKTTSEEDVVRAQITEFMFTKTDKVIRKTKKPMYFKR